MILWHNLLKSYNLSLLLFTSSSPPHPISFPTSSHHFIFFCDLSGINMPTYSAMDIFRRALEYTLTREKNKTALYTRRTCKKQINALELTIAGLKSELQSKVPSYLLALPPFSHILHLPFSHPRRMCTQQVQLIIILVNWYISFLPSISIHLFV